MKGILRLEVEKLHTTHVEADNFSESGSVANESNDAGYQFAESSMKYVGNGYDGLRNGNLKGNTSDKREQQKNVQNMITGSYLDTNNEEVVSGFAVSFSFGLSFTFSNFYCSLLLILLFLSGSVLMVDSKLS